MFSYLLPRVVCDGCRGSRFGSVEPEPDFGPQRRVGCILVFRRFEVESEPAQFGYNFVKRFSAEVSDFEHVLFGLAREVGNGVYARAFQAVVAAHGQVHFLDIHFEYFCLTVFRSRYEYVHAGNRVGQRNEQFYVVFERFCRKAQHVLRG